MCTDRGLLFGTTLLLLVVGTNAAYGKIECSTSTKNWPKIRHAEGRFSIKIPPGWTSRSGGVQDVALLLSAPAGRSEINVRVVPPPSAATQGMPVCGLCKPLVAGGQLGWILRELGRTLAEFPHPAFPEGGRLSLELSPLDSESQAAFECVLESLWFLPGVRLPAREQNSQKLNRR